MPVRSIDPPTALPIGLAAFLGATLLWGFLPLYWKLLSHIPAVQVIAHRTVWTALMTLALFAARGQGPALLRAFRNRRQLAATAASSFLITANGCLFVWAVAQGRVTEVSLGYYLTPLVAVALGALVLRERLTRLQMIAVGIAGLGVLFMARGLGFPWVSIGLASCFGLYGLVRKVAPVEALLGLTMEMTLAMPLCLLYLGMLPVPLGEVVAGPALDRVLLLLSGIATALPLFLFAFGTRRLPYATVGILLYVTPTLHLLVAVAFFGEPFTADHAITFALIWSAVALFVGNNLLQARLRPAPAPGSAEPG
ncbi:MAG: EamA family transporter RarD [Sandaracinaceae bacterium]